MTREELIRNLKYTMKKHEKDVIDTFGTNISLMCKDVLDYLEQQPCEDCISRQEAINCVTSNEFRYKIVEDIKTLPSVAPKEKTGHWINNHTQCSNCEWGIEDDVVGSPMMLFFPFCPNCGAKMVEPQESEVDNG